MDNEVTEKMARAFVVSLSPLLLIVLVIKGAGFWRWLRKRGRY